MTAPPSPTARPLTPRAERHLVAFDVDVEGPTTPAYRTPVRNVSASGMLLKDAGALQVGDVLSARLPSLGPIVCRVVRLRGGEAGVKFDRTIAVKDLLVA